MIIESVFLSHATEDHDIALRVRDFLESEHIHVWLAPEDIAVGSANWDAEIHSAVKAADGLVLIASPDSRKSPYVRGEVDLAQGKPIFVLFARGDKPEDTMLLEHVGGQFADIHGEAFSDGMRLLVATCRDEIGSQSRWEQAERRTLGHIQEAERAELFRAFRDRAKSAWRGAFTWTQVKTAVQETADASTAYVYAINDLKRRWGTHYIAPTDNMTSNLIAIIEKLHTILRDDTKHPVLKTAALVQHGGLLLTEIERHWGKFGSRTIDGTVEPRTNTIDDNGTIGPRTDTTDDDAS